MANPDLFRLNFDNVLSGNEPLSQMTQELVYPSATFPLVPSSHWAATFPGTLTDTFGASPVHPPHLRAPPLAAPAYAAAGHPSGLGVPPSTSALLAAAQQQQNPAPHVGGGLTTPTTASASASNDGNTTRSAGKTTTEGKRGRGKGGAKGRGGATKKAKTAAPKKKKGGLREYAKQVCDLVKDLGRTSYEQVAEKLAEADRVRRERQAAAAAAAAGGSAKPVVGDDKNVRRRAYDALNVLEAVRIIERDDKEIVWAGYPKESLDPMKEKQQEMQSRRARVCKKEATLHELQHQLRMYELLKQRNLKADFSPQAHLSLPFMLITCPQTANVQCFKRADDTEYRFEFSEPFQLINDVTLVQYLLAGGDAAAPGQQAQQGYPDHQQPVVLSFDSPRSVTPTADV